MYFETSTSFAPVKTHELKFISFCFQFYFSFSFGFKVGNYGPRRTHIQSLFIYSVLFQSTTLPLEKVMKRQLSNLNSIELKKNEKNPRKKQTTKQKERPRHKQRLVVMKILSAINVDLLTTIY